MANLPKKKAWDPDWVIAPAETLTEWIKENLGEQVVASGRGPGLLAVMGAPREQREAAEKAIEDVLARKPLGKNVANLLQSATMISARFWLALEHNYRVGLVAGKKDVT